jgi:hypothetical protein
MAVRKVKNLLTGLAPTDSDVAALTTSGEVGLQGLITTWMTNATYQPYFQGKMMVFFRNTFQQTGFSPLNDFKPQLLQNGGFDFGPLGTLAVGDSSFALLVQNLQDSFARTTLGLISEGQPFSSTLTTQKYMMTTGLKSLYLQIEMPNDQPYAFPMPPNPLQWKINYSGNPIALTDTLNPSSPNYMVFGDDPPVNNSYFPSTAFPTCRGGTPSTANTVVTTGSFTGYAQLFQRLLGYTPRYPFVGSPTCWEHPSKPYFTTADMSDWQWVTVRALNPGEAYVQPYDLPTIRTLTEIAVALPRVGFYTTPAFLALWNTNDSNQHRVTADQALLAALGQSFSSDSTIIPLSEPGLDPAHSVTGSECYGCHKSLDPMRQFWANQFDFNDRNDFITASYTGAPPNPRPTTLGGVFAFDDVNQAGANMLAYGPLLGKVTDSDPVMPLNQFAIGVTQKLCFYANSVACSLSDPEFRRVVAAFQANYDFGVLVTQFFASPLVTGAVATATFNPQGSVAVSISRRDHFCAALSNRLGVTDVCALVAPLPTQAQTATNTIAGALPADAFGRGVSAPVTPAQPSVFYRAGSEELCENIAPQVVDATTGTVWSSSSATAAITDMVERVVGYSPGDPNHDPAVTILQSHYTSVLGQAGSSATIALRSTFVLACESPTAVSIGL